MCESQHIIIGWSLKLKNERKVDARIIIVQEITTHVPPEAPYTTPHFIVYQVYCTLPRIWLYLVVYEKDCRLYTNRTNTEVQVHYIYLVLSVCLTTNNYSKIKKK